MKYIKRYIAVLSAIKSEDRVEYDPVECKKEITSFKLFANCLIILEGETFVLSVVRYLHLQ